MLGADSDFDGARLQDNNYKTMAVEQLFEAVPLHYLQHGLTKYGASNIALAFLVTLGLGVLMDYAWMLYLRSKMVSMVDPGLA